MLDVQNLTVDYGVIRGVDDISFSVGKGEIVTLIGANGAGKTTSLRAISGLCKVSGKTKITFGGVDITNAPAHTIVKRGLCHVPEGRRIFPTMSVWENLMMGAYTQKDANVIKNNVERVYSLFPRLKERQKQLGGTLSGGEQQMLAIGRALMTGGNTVLFDEPSMGLAPIIILEIFEIIKNLKKEGVTVLLVEQTANMALSIADRAYVLETGRIILSGPAAEIKANENVKKAYLGA